MENPPSEQLAGLDRARFYIAQVRWIYAKTMPQWPHEYTLRRERPDLVDEFVFFVLFIRQYGYQARWGRNLHHYYDVDGHKYWTMGAPVAMTILINRAQLQTLALSVPPERDEHG